MSKTYDIHPNPFFLAARRMAEVIQQHISHSTNPNIEPVEMCAFAEAVAEHDATKCKHGFTPNPDCDNCDGTGIFVEEGPHDGEPCIFCMEDAIMSGEIDGTIETSQYVRGKLIS